jgi:hypothetical protein
VQNEGWKLLCEFLFYGVASLFIGEKTKAFFMYLAPKIGVAKNVSKPRNVRKFGHQMWHGVIHVSMTIAEIYILGRPEVQWRWFVGPFPSIHAHTHTHARTHPRAR